jgi:hypothetical protein
LAVAVADKRKVDVWPLGRHDPIVTMKLLASIAVALVFAAPAAAETWKASNPIPVSISKPRPLCKFFHSEALARAALHDVRVVKWRCQSYPKHGRWTPMDAYVRMSGRVVDGRGNPYTSRYLSYMVDFRRHFVRIWGSDEV